METKHLRELSEQFGCPLYVYDAEKIQSQYTRLANAFSNVKSLRINYAAKALSNISVLKLLKQMGSGLDTVSIQEVQLGLLAGFAPHDIIYTPNGVSMEEIEEVAALGVQINIDNLSILEQFGAKHPGTPVCIRINPHVMAGGNSNISVGHIDSKFGISIHQMPHLLRIVANTKMHINGIHMHTGSDILTLRFFFTLQRFFLRLQRILQHWSFLTSAADLRFRIKKTILKPMLKNWAKSWANASMHFVPNMAAT